MRTALYPATVDIAAVIYENPAGTIVRRVEGDFNFDAPFGTEKLHALVRDELGAAGENRLPGREIQNHGGEAIRAEFRVSFDQADDSRRLFSEDETRSGNGIAADVVNSSAAPVQNVANIRSIAIEIAEDTGDGAQVADSTGADQFSSAQPLRMRSNHEGFADFYASAVARGEESLCFRDVQADWLLAKHVLPGLRSFYRPGDV